MAHDFTVHLEDYACNNYKPLRKEYKHERNTRKDWLLVPSYTVGVNRVIHMFKEGKDRRAEEEGSGVVWRKKGAGVRKREDKKTGRRDQERSWRKRREMR